MKSLTIKAEKRTELGKKANKALRAADRVPGVLYGGENVLHFHMFRNDLRHLLFTPEIYFVDLDIDGEIYRAIKQETQFHPVTDNILHIDFLQIFDDKAVAMNVPFVVEGQSSGVKKGGVLKKEMRYIPLKGIPAVLPEKVVVDVTAMEVNDTMKVSDVEVADVEILLNPNMPVVRVVAGRGMTDEGKEGEDGEGAEE